MHTPLWVYSNQTISTGAQLETTRRSDKRKNKKVLNADFNNTFRCQKSKKTYALGSVDDEVSELVVLVRAHSGVLDAVDAETVAGLLVGVGVDGEVLCFVDGLSLLRAVFLDDGSLVGLGLKQNQ